MKKKQLLDLMASLIVEVMLRKKDDPGFNIDIETEKKTKELIINLFSNIFI